MILQNILNGIDAAAANTLVDWVAKYRQILEHEMILSRISAFIKGVIAAGEGIIDSAIISEAIRYAARREEEVGEKLEALINSERY